MHKSNCRGASPPLLNNDLHAIDATPARWRGLGGLPSLDSVSTVAFSSRKDLVKNYRVHSTHWLIYAQALKPPLRDPTAAQQSKYWGVTWARKQSKQ